MHYYGNTGGKESATIDCSVDIIDNDTVTAQLIDHGRKRWKEGEKVLAKELAAEKNLVSVSAS